MAATAVVQPGSKGSNKKAAVAAKRAESPAPSSGSDAAVGLQDDGLESSHIKELQKNIRNLNKKITNASKTDSLLREHVGKPLDELVASKIINSDQKAQIEKKPALKAQLVQAEEQLAQLQKVHEHYRARLAADKAEWETSLETMKADAAAEAEVGFRKRIEDCLLTLSQFLRLAAYRREEAREPDSDESQAIEGALLAIYAGDEYAVSSMLKLVEGAKDQVLSVPGEQLQTTYAVVKGLAQEFRTPLHNQATQLNEVGESFTGANGTTATDTAPTEISVDELPASVDQPGQEPLQNGHTSTTSVEDADNSTIEGQWDSEHGLSASQEWVEVKVPQEFSEAGSAHFATDLNGLRSWADDHPEPAQQPLSNSTDPNEGFHPVQRNKPRQEREGNAGGNGYSRGRGRGDHRGRGGYRGDGRGRGRGRGNGASRPRRSDDF